MRSVNSKNIFSYFLALSLVLFFQPIAQGEVATPKVNLDSPKSVFKPASEEELLALDIVIAKRTNLDGSINLWFCVALVGEVCIVEVEETDSPEETLCEGDLCEQPKKRPEWECLHKSKCMKLTFNIPAKDFERMFPDPYWEKAHYFQEEVIKKSVNDVLDLAERELKKMWGWTSEGINPWLVVAGGGAAFGGAAFSDAKKNKVRLAKIYKGPISLFFGNKKRAFTTIFIIGTTLLTYQSEILVKFIAGFYYYKHKIGDSHSEQDNIAFADFVYKSDYDWRQAIEPGSKEKNAKSAVSKYIKKICRGIEISEEKKIISVYDIFGEKKEFENTTYVERRDERNLGSVCGKVDAPPVVKTSPVVEAENTDEQADGSMIEELLSVFETENTDKQTDEDMPEETKYDEAASTPTATVENEAGEGEEARRLVFCEEPFVDEETKTLECDEHPILFGPPRPVVVDSRIREIAPHEYNRKKNQVDRKIISRIRGNKTDR